MNTWGVVGGGGGGGVGGGGVGGGGGGWGGGGGGGGGLQSIHDTFKSYIGTLTVTGDNHFWYNGKMLLNDNQPSQVQWKMWTYLVLPALCFPICLKIKNTWKYVNRV